MATGPHESVWAHFARMTDADVSKWLPKLLALPKGHRLNFMLHAASEPGEHASNVWEPSMLGAAVRYFPDNPRAFEMTVTLLRGLDDADARAVVSADDGAGSTALMDAVMAVPSSPSLLDQVLALPGATATINASDVEGRSALMRAARQNFGDAVRVVSASGADVEQRDHAGRTALWHACDAKGVGSAAALLSLDATIDGPTVWSCGVFTAMSFVTILTFGAVMLYSLSRVPIRWRTLFNASDAAARVRRRGRRIPIVQLQAPVGAAQLSSLARALLRPELRRLDVLFPLSAIILATAPALVVTVDDERRFLLNALLMYISLPAAGALPAAFLPCVDDGGAALLKQPRALCCMRVLALLYLPFVYGVYRHALLVPLQRLDGLTILRGQRPLTLSSCLYLVVSAHLAIWFLLSIPIVLAGCCLTERLRTRFPPWAILRGAACAIGLNDLALHLCLQTYSCLTHLGGANPLPPHTYIQLSALYERTRVAAISLLSIAAVLTPENRGWLSSRRLSLVQTVASHFSASGTEVTKRECVVCMDGEASHILAPCGHMCACGACATLLVESGAVCPLCRASVASIVAQVWT